MIADKVTMKPDTIIEHYGDYMITAFTDGNYDKKLAPDPLYLDYFFTLKNDKIIKMFVILNKEKSINKKCDEINVQIKIKRNDDLIPVFVRKREAVIFTIAEGRNPVQKPHIINSISELHRIFSLSKPEHPPDQCDRPGRKPIVLPVKLQTVSYLIF